MILQDLCNHFGFNTLEQLIVNIAAYIRQQNGDYASFTALLAGTEICPESSVIKFDCCSDLMNLMERQEIKDREWGKEKFTELLYMIDEKQINPDFIANLFEYRNWAQTLTN